MIGDEEKGESNMWIARNENGSLHMWVLSGKPKRHSGENYSSGLGMWKFSIDTGHKLPDTLYPNLTWNDEPIEVFLTDRKSLDSEFNDMFCQLCVDYSIPDEVADKFIDIFISRICG